LVPCLLLLGLRRVFFGQFLKERHRRLAGLAVGRVKDDGRVGGGALGFRQEALDGVDVRYLLNEFAGRSRCLGVLGAQKALDPGSDAFPATGGAAVAAGRGRRMVDQGGFAGGVSVSVSSVGIIIIIIAVDIVVDVVRIALHAQTGFAVAVSVAPVPVPVPVWFCWHSYCVCGLHGSTAQRSCGPCLALHTKCSHASAVAPSARRQQHGGVKEDRCSFSYYSCHGAMWWDVVYAYGAVSV